MKSISSFASAKTDLPMVDEAQRAQLVQELREVLEEVAQLSDRTATQLGTRSLGVSKPDTLRVELGAAKTRAVKLRKAIDLIDVDS